MLHPEHSRRGVSLRRQEHVRIDGAGLKILRLFQNRPWALACPRVNLIATRPEGGILGKTNAPKNPDEPTDDFLGQLVDCEVCPGSGQYVNEFDDKGGSKIVPRCAAHTDFLKTRLGPHPSLLS